MSMMNETDEHNKWKHGYWRLKKENSTLRLRLEVATTRIDEYKEEHEREVIELCEEIDGLRRQVIEARAGARMVMHLTREGTLTPEDGEWLIDEVYV